MPLSFDLCLVLYIPVFCFGSVWLEFEDPFYTWRNWNNLFTKLHAHACVYIILIDQIHSTLGQHQNNTQYTCTYQLNSCYDFKLLCCISWCNQHNNLSARSCPLLSLYKNEQITPSITEACLHNHLTMYCRPTKFIICII